MFRAVHDQAALERTHASPFPFFRQGSHGKAVRTSLLTRFKTASLSSKGFNLDSKVKLTIG